MSLRPKKDDMSADVPSFKTSEGDKDLLGNFKLTEHEVQTSCKPGSCYPFACDIVFYKPYPPINALQDGTISPKSYFCGNAEIPDKVASP